MLPPAGIFTPKDLDADLLLFAGGSGITPVMSIIRTALARGTGQIVLFYANRDDRSVIFADALAELAAEHPDRLQVVHWLESVQGLPTQDQIRAFAAQYVDRDAFVCGPAPFMASTVAALKELEFPRERRHQEKFVSLGGNPFETDAERVPGAATAWTTSDRGIPAPTGPRRHTCWSTSTARTTSSTTGSRGRRSSSTSRARGSRRRTPAGRESARPAPCACWRAKSTMRANDILEDEDLADGIRLGCQSEAVTEKVRVTYS